MSKNRGKWTNRIYDEDRQSSYQLDRASGNRMTAHGEPGHTGWKCIGCAMEAPTVVSVFPPYDDDAWQDVQLKWQEECDVLQNEKIDHLPDHTPAKGPCHPRSRKCVIYTQQPEKPVKQFERLNNRVFKGDP